MGFVGPVSELSGRWIRPHDVEILLRAERRRARRR